MQICSCLGKFWRLYRWHNSTIYSRESTVSEFFTLTLFIALQYLQIQILFVFFADEYPAMYGENWSRVNEKYLPQKFLKRYGNKRVRNRLKVVRTAI